MQEISVWKASDGKLFENRWECQKHEDELAADILNAYVLGFDEDGNQVSWSADKYIVFALLLRHPTSEDLEDLSLDCAWANYLDPDLECDKNFMFGKTGWYVRDDRCDQWYRWEDYSAHFRKLADHMTDLIEEHKD